MPLFDIGQSTLSHHLNKLSAVGLVQVDRRHRYHTAGCRLTCTRNHREGAVYLVPKVTSIVSCHGKETR